MAPCGLPSTRSWDRTHRSEGVMKAGFPHRFQPHWEASHHIQLGKNLKPWGAGGGGAYQCWTQILVQEETLAGES